MKILIGCDPEVFVKKGDKFMSAYGLIKGDKRNPQKVHNGAVQVDGMALEFNIDPARNEDEFVFNVQDVYQQMKMMVPDYEVVAVPVARFDPEYMKKQPQEALELGCDPDYNAWLGMVNDRPDGDRPMRTAAGHIHIGWTEKQDVQNPVHMMQAREVIKQMDFYLGLPSLTYDSDTDRRSMYGKAGCCRFKPYGAEYRTLSNAWLQNDKLMRSVYRNAVAGVEALMKGKNLSQKYGDIQEIINTSNIKEAMKIVKEENIEVCYG